MKSMKATLFLAAIMALVFTSCHSNREKEKIDIHGQWEMEGEKNHVYILFETPPQVQLSKLVNTLKNVSSRLIKKQYEQYLKKYYWKSAFWSRSYCIVSSGGATIETIKRYIENQGKA